MKQISSQWDLSTNMFRLWKEIDGPDGEKFGNEI
jgi:hypothetical protein